MASIRAGAAAPDRIAAAAETPDVLTVAIALRWERPDLTGQLADHVLGAAEAAGDRDHWLHAAGWAVHARSATGDGRPVASTALEGVRRWGAAALTVPAAYRLRVELAVVAIGSGQPDRARALLAPVATAATSPLLRADARTALARCAMEDGPREVMSELRNAHAAWSEVRGRDANLGLAATELVAAAAHRRAGRPDASAAAATAGLSRLRERPGNGSAGTPSGYLSAALTTEWISALLDTGRVDEAQDGCEPLFGWLGEPPRPCRQLARLRLTVARAVASGTAPEVTAQALAKAAQDAADSDAPDLEVVSRAALSALLQQLGRADEANAAILLAAQAERRDKHRDQLFRAVLGAATVPGSDVLATAPSPWPGAPTDNGNVQNDRPDPCDHLPVRGQRVGGIDAIAAQGLGLRDADTAPAVPGGTGSPAEPPAAPSGPVGRRPVDPTGTAPRPVESAAAAPQNGRPEPPSSAPVPPRPSTRQWPWVDVAVEPPGNWGPAGTSGPLAGVGAPDDPRAPASDAHGPAEEAGRGAPEGIAVSWPPLPSVAEVRADAGDQRFDWPWAGRPGDSPIGDLLMDRLRVNRAAAEREGARRARHGSLDGGPPAAADSVPVDGGSQVPAGPASKRPGPETEAGSTNRAAGSPDGRPPGMGAAEPVPPAHTARPAPPRPSDNPWTTGSWAGRRSGSRPVPAMNGELPPGGSAPAGESPGAVARNVTVPPASMPNEAAREGAAGAGMEPVGFDDASRTAPDAGSGDRARGGPAAGNAVSRAAGSGVVRPELDRGKATVPERGSGDTADASAAAQNPVPGEAGSGVVHPGSRRTDASVPEAGSGDTARDGAAARGPMSGGAGGDVVPPESVSAESGLASAPIPFAGSDDRGRGGAARDLDSGAGSGVVPPGLAPAEAGRAGAPVPEAPPGDRARGGSASRDLVSGGGVVPPRSVPAESGLAGAPVPEAGSDDRARGCAVVRDLASGVASGGVVPPESAPAELSRMGEAGSGDRAPGGKTARDVVRSEAAAPESAPAELGPAGATVSGTASDDTAHGAAAARAAELDRTNATVPESTPGGTAHASAAASRDPAPTDSERTAGVTSEARSEEARGEVERGIATALDAALTEAISGASAPGDPSAHGVKASGTAHSNSTTTERLRGALEDVDRAWNLAFGVSPRPAAPAVEECRIVIDVARDGRRFAGPRAAAVLQTIAGRLHLQLPVGARVGTEPHDGLVIEIPSTGHASAARWMNHTVPGLLDGLTFDDDFARLHLRSVVYGADGPVGAQLLVRLDQAPLESPSDRSPSPERPARGSAIESAAGVGGSEVAGAEPVVDTCGCPTEAALPVEQPRSDLTGLPGPGDDPLAAGNGELVTGRESSSGSDGAAAAGNGVPVADEKSTGAPALGIGAVLAGGALSATYGGPVGADVMIGAVVADGLPAGRNSSGGAAIGNGAPALGREGHEAVEGPAGADPRSPGDNGVPVAGREGHEAVEGPAGAPSSGDNGAPVDPGPDEAAAPSGRHAATDRTPFRPPTSTHNPGSEGRRHRTDPEEMPDTEGLGLADLLAGALAAYRGI